MKYFVSVYYDKGILFSTEEDALKFIGLLLNNPLYEMNYNDELKQTEYKTSFTVKAFTEKELKAMEFKQKVLKE